MERTRYPSPALRGLRHVVAGLHVLMLLAVAGVPLFALFAALASLGTATQQTAWAHLVDGSRWYLLLANTATVCATAVVTAVVLGGALGLLAARTDLPGQRVLLGAALFGACVPVYVSATAFFARLPIYSLTGSAWACGLLCGLVYVPLAGLGLAAAFQAADRELEDQATLDGGPLRVLLSVTIPQAGWGITATGLIVGLLVATDFSIADILQVRTFAEEVYTQFALRPTSAGPVLTAAPLIAALSVLLLGAHACFRRLGETSLGTSGQRPRTFALGRWRTTLGGVSVAAIAAGLLLPLGLLVSRAGPLTGLGRVVLDLQRELWTSAALGSTAATVALAPAMGFAWHLARGGRSRWLTAAALVLLLATPAPVIGISLISLLNRPPWGALYDSPVVVVLGHVVRFLPVTVLLLLPGVRRIARELEWAARADGCDWVAEHWHIRWPLLWPDAALAWLVTLILCFGEVGTAALVVPPAWPLVSVRAFTLIHFGVYRDLAVLALLAVGFMLLPWGLLLWTLRRLTARSARPGDCSGGK